MKHLFNLINQFQNDLHTGYNRTCVSSLHAVLHKLYLMMSQQATACISKARGGVYSFQVYIHKAQHSAWSCIRLHACMLVHVAYFLFFSFLTERAWHARVLSPGQTAPFLCSCFHLTNTCSCVCSIWRLGGVLFSFTVLSRCQSRARVESWPLTSLLSYNNFLNPQKASARFFRSSH